MTVDLTPDELESIFRRLDPDAKDHIGSILKARAAEERRHALDSDTSDTLSQGNKGDTLSPLGMERRAALSRSVGIDDDLIGCSIAREPLDAGHNMEDTAGLIAEAGIAWRPRTRAERLEAAEAEMLAHGWDPDVTRDAFAQLEVAQ